MILLAISLLAVLGILLTGLVAFAKGSDFHDKYGSKLMQMRVAAQAVAVVLVLLLVMIRSAGN